MVTSINFFLLILLICSGPFGWAQARQLSSASTVDEAFLQQDQELMEILQQGFFKSSKRSETVSMHHGQKTEEVYVFLHGLFSDREKLMKGARQKYSEGANVIVGTLPGHEDRKLEEANNSAGIWLEYAETLGMVARRYGKKVVFVGRSTGANLAVRAAESGNADELVLIQPLFDVSSYGKAAIKLGKMLPERMKRQSKINCLTQDILGRNGAGINEVLNAVKQAEITGGLSYRPIPSSIPVVVYMADKDPVVSAQAIKKWVQKNAPHAQVNHNKNPWDHMYDPF